MNINYLYQYILYQKMNINIIDLPIDLIIEILSHISYDLPMFNLLYSNKYLYSILDDYYIIILKLIEPRINYLAEYINNSKRCAVIVNNFMSFINIIFIKYTKLNIDIILQSQGYEFIITIVLFLLTIHIRSNTKDIVKLSSNTITKRKFICIDDSNMFLISLGISNVELYEYNKYVFITENIHKVFKIKLIKSKHSMDENVDIIVNLQGINLYNKNIELISIGKMFKVFEVLKSKCYLNR